MPLHPYGYRHWVFLKYFTNERENATQCALLKKLRIIVLKLKKTPNNRILQDNFMKLKKSITEREKALKIENYEKIREYEFDL